MWVLISIVFIIIVSKLILRGTGVFVKPTYQQIVLFSLFIIYVLSSKKAFWFIGFPLILIYVLYLPVGLSFGYPQYQHIVSFFATDASEAGEFLSLIPIKNYLYALFVLLSIIFVRYIFKSKSINFLKNKLFLISSSLFFLFYLTPFEFFHKSYSEYVKVKETLKILDNGITSQWGNSQLKSSKYDDYVLIIGESARADYFNFYGYPIENTPFLSSANGTFVHGLLAAGGYTIGSLKLMLTKPDTAKWKENYNLNIVDLIKSSGIKTYWLSNQGFIGRWDTPITSIANRSDVKYFLKSGEYNSRNTDDFDLLPKFKEIISKNYKGKRFIVLHTLGSHPHACDRVKNYSHIFKTQDIDKKYSYINCYISSIKKTDEFISSVFNILNKSYDSNKRTFSLIYFSDHGLGHKEVDGKLVLNNNPDVARGNAYFTVPLLKISSDDKERNIYNVFKSGLNFTDGIAHWIGIDNDKLNSKADLFNGLNDPDSYGQIEKLKKITKDDSAVDIRPK